jgi:hypothetical protein
VLANHIERLLMPQNAIVRKTIEAARGVAITTARGV